MVKPDRYERAARALCRFNGVPENTTFEGRPMWQSFLPEVKAVLEAALTPEELSRLASADAANPGKEKPAG